MVDDRHAKVRQEQLLEGDVGVAAAALQRYITRKLPRLNLDPIEAGGSYKASCLGRRRLASHTPSAESLCQVCMNNETSNGERWYLSILA